MVVAAQAHQLNAMLISRLAAAGNLYLPTLLPKVDCVVLNFCNELGAGGVRWLM